MKPSCRYGGRFIFFMQRLDTIIDSDRVAVAVLLGRGPLVSSFAAMVEQMGPETCARMKVLAATASNKRRFEVSVS